MCASIDSIQSISNTKAKDEFSYEQATIKLINCERLKQISNKNKHYVIKLIFHLCPNEQLSALVAY